MKSKNYTRAKHLRSCRQAYEAGDLSAFNREILPLGVELAPHKDDLTARVRVPHLVGLVESMIDLTFVRQDTQLLRRLLAITPPCIDYCELARIAAEAGWARGFAAFRDGATDGEGGPVLGMSLIGAFRMRDATAYHHPDDAFGSEADLLAEFVEEALGDGAHLATIRRFMAKGPGRGQGVMWPAVP